MRSMSLRRDELPLVQIRSPVPVSELNIIIHLELERMRAKPQRIVFLLFHLDPVVDEVGVKDVAAKQEGVIGFQRCDRSA